MKVKYYLRGLGTGILFATVILTISFAVRENSVQGNEQDITQKTTIQETTEETKIIETTTQEIETTQNSLNDYSVSVTVESGMSSEGVAAMLERAGVIENASEFDEYLRQNDYSKIISVGTYNIEPNSSYEEIAKIITKTN